MATNSKDHEDKFSIRSLESAYLPFMFNENNLSRVEGDHEDRNSLDLISSYKGKFTTDSTNVTSTGLQSTTSSQRRMGPHILTNYGMSFFKTFHSSLSQFANVI